MSIIGHRITSLAIAGMLCIGMRRSGFAQTAATADAVSIETVSVTVYRVKTPAMAPIAKSETKGRAPSKDAIWVPGFWNLQGNPNTGPSAGWVWVPGRWLTPPVAGARWDPAHWGWSDDQSTNEGERGERWWSWIPGQWVQRGQHGFPPSLQSDEMS
jgi:hypothetical protein